MGNSPTTAAPSYRALSVKEPVPITIDKCWSRVPGEFSIDASEEVILRLKDLSSEGTLVLSFCGKPYMCLSELIEDITCTDYTHTLPLAFYLTSKEATIYVWIAERWNLLLAHFHVNWSEKRLALVTMKQYRHWEK